MLIRGEDLGHWVVDPGSQGVKSDPQKILRFGVTGAGSLCCDSVGFGSEEAEVLA